MFSRKKSQRKTNLRVRPRLRRRCTVEALETRQMLSTAQQTLIGGPPLQTVNHAIAMTTSLPAPSIGWTGGDGTSWDDAANWTVVGTTVHRVPQAGDDVLIGNSADVQITGPETIDSLQVQSGATLDLDNGNLTIGNGLTNDGTITMISQKDNATLTVTSGVLLNAGTFEYNGGDGFIVAALDNTGTIHVANGLPHFNLSSNPPGIWQPVDSSYTFTNTGTIQVDAGQGCGIGGMAGPGDLGTSITGTGFLCVLANGANAWNLGAAGWTLPATTAMLGFYDSKITGTGNLTIPASDTLVVGDSTVSDGIVDNGTLASFGGLGSTITGNVTVEAGGTLSVGVPSFNVQYLGPSLGAPAVGTLTVNGNVTNDGTIDLYNTFAGGTLTVNGTLTNNGGIQTPIVSGNTGAAIGLNADIDNQGTIDVTVSNLGINQGTAGSKLTFTNEAGATLELGTKQTLDIGGAKVIDDGTIKLDGNATLDFNFTSPSDSLTIDGQGTLQGTATDTLEISGSLLGNTTNGAGFTQPGTLVFDGSGTANAPQLLELMELDQGNVPAGFSSSLAYGTLELGDKTYVELVDQSQNSPGPQHDAGYTDALTVPSGSTLDRNGLHLYVKGSPSPIPTTTVVTASPSTAVYGQSVTFTATVAPSSGTFDDSGTVQFAVDGQNLGPLESLNSRGVATFVTSSLTAGTHTITATYSGDAAFNGSVGTLGGTGKVYDPAADFEQGWKAATNPNGVWSYGFSSGPTGPVTLYGTTVQNGVNGPQAQYW
ncbi:MAG: Ig-like domain repeat protein, partial [Thermoguttaceae bacterium]